MNAPAATNGKKSAADAGGLKGGKADADKGFHQQKTAGQAAEECPPCKERSLTVVWTTEEVRRVG